MIIHRNKNLEKDYLIIGQGIAGSMIAYELMRMEATLDVINLTDHSASSRVAAGLYNPVSGRKMVKSWNADRLFDGLETHYRELENKFGTSFLHPTGIYRPFFTQEEQNEWQGRIADGHYDNFVRELKTGSSFSEKIRDAYGGLYLKNAGYVDIPRMLESFRAYFLENLSYKEKKYTPDQLEIMETGVSYNEVVYKRVIFCEGSAISSNPWFNWLPMKPVKGEIIDVNIDYRESFILNRGVFLLPENDQGYCRLGSTYDNHRLDYEVTDEALNYLKEKLGIIFDGELKVVNHKAGIRPATRDRKPLAGRHPSNEDLIIFNGLGAKGVSLAVFYAKQLAEHLENSKPLDREVNIARFLSFYPN